MSLFNLKRSKQFVVFSMFGTAALFLLHYFVILSPQKSTGVIKIQEKHIQQPSQIGNLPVLNQPVVAQNPLLNNGNRNQLSGNRIQPTQTGNNIIHVQGPLQTRIPPVQGPGPGVNMNPIPQGQIGGTGTSINTVTNKGSNQSLPQVPPPQAKNEPQTKILRWNGKGWYQLQNYCAGHTNFKQTILKSAIGTGVIFIHDLKDDKWVSGSLKSQGMWDVADINVMIGNLRTDPELGFIDIGSHVGTFSLVAALMGRKAVAVDPLVSNVLRFCKSVQANKFTDKITIFFTAISNSYKKVSFKREYGNIGGTRIQAAPPTVNTSNVYDPNYIDTVRLDDLVPYIPFKKAFVKMDVEEHEYEVVTSGVKFFQDIDVRGILMEWMWQKAGKNGLALRDYLLAYKFKPYTPNGIKELDITQYRSWPNDVLWKKMS